METIVRSILTACTKKISTKGRVITFVGTKESPDRTGDVIRVAGWEFANFEKNPVFLWNHDTRIPPIGKVIKILTIGKEVHFDVQFAPASLNEFADLIFKSFAEGFLSAVSVGFLVKDLEPIFIDGDLVGLDILRQELLELSAVAIPAHQDALAASIYGKRMAAVCENFLQDSETEKFDKALSLEEYRKSLPPFTEEVDEPMTEMQEQLFKALVIRVDELEATQKSLITLRESVDLSVKTMETLNKSVVALLSKEAPVTPAVKTETPDGSTPSPTLDLPKLMGALGIAIEKINKSKSQFTVEGDK